MILGAPINSMLSPMVCPIRPNGWNATQLRRRTTEKPDSYALRKGEKRPPPVRLASFSNVTRAPGVCKGNRVANLPGCEQ